MEIEDLIMKMKDVYLADKLEKIFQYLIDYAPSPISYFISDYTKYSQPVLSLLLRKGFLKIDDSFLDQYFQSKSNLNLSYYLLYPAIKKYIDANKQIQIEEEILEIFNEDLSTID